MDSQPLLFDMTDNAGAIFDPDRNYRYRLWRRWGDGPPILWIMLNPSTADETVLDPTLRRCIDFSTRWGFGAMEIANLYAYRSTKPEVLLTVPDPVGSENLQHIEDVLTTAAKVMVAWGSKVKSKSKSEAIRAVVDLMARHGVRPHCLTANTDGHPTHPLYIPKVSPPVPWPKPGERLAEIREQLWSDR